MKKAYFLILLSFFSISTFADELVLPKAVFSAMGYMPFSEFQKVHTSMEAFALAAEPAKGLAWPVAFQDSKHSIGQNYLQFQEYEAGSSYIHGGCDLRAKGSSEVRAPVTGRLEGGYYGYTDNADGSMEKQWSSWTGTPQHDPYFELAIVTDDGYRFEMHHVDSEALPQNTISALNKGNVVIQAGTVIGKVNPWAFTDQSYDHIHYNIIRSDGVRLNPEYYSLAIAQHSPPKVQSIFGITASGKVLTLQEGGTITEPLLAFVVAATDGFDNDVYVQPPLFAEVKFEQGNSFGWDFRKTLQTASGAWPDIRDVFTNSIQAPNGKTLNTSGNWGEGLFLMHIPVSTQIAHGKFDISIGDTTGNMSHIHGVIN